MTYPKLVPRWVCRTDILIEVQDGETENGEANFTSEISLKCNFQGRDQYTVDADKHTVTYSATALFDGDIFPGVNEIAGRATVYDRVYRIASCYKARNPDGTVNYTRLELM